MPKDSIIEFRVDRTFRDLCDEKARTKNMTLSQWARAVLHDQATRVDGADIERNGYANGWDEGFKASTSFVKKEIMVLLAQLGDKARAFAGIS